MEPSAPSLLPALDILGLNATISRREGEKESKQHLPQEADKDVWVILYIAALYKARRTECNTESARLREEGPSAAPSQECK